MRYSQGSSIKEIRTKELSKLKIMLPKIDEQIKISHCLCKFEDEIQLIETKLSILTQQKKGLMQNLLTGKIRVNT